MGHIVKTKDLQVGMRMVSPILGKKGDVKVNAGEILSKAHVDKLNKWKGVDDANPRGIEVESSPLHSGSEMPNVVANPWESPIIQAKSKQNLQSSISVPAITDKDGRVLNPSPFEKRIAQRENESNITKYKRGRGRPKKS